MAPGGKKARSGLNDYRQNDDHDSFDQYRDHDSKLILVRNVLLNHIIKQSTAFIFVFCYISSNTQNHSPKKTDSYLKYNFFFSK